MTKPIFVVGARRSGTTWLGNLVAQHSGVAGLQGGAGGIYETAFFSHLAGRYGDLRQVNCLIPFLQVFTNSTYFLCSGIRQEDLYRLRPSSYAETFRWFMDQIAAQQHTEYWVEKTPAHALHLEEIEACYPDARFVAIRRDILDQVKSSIQLGALQSRKQSLTPPPKAGPRVLFRKVLAYYNFNKHIDAFAARHPDRIHCVRYEQLKKSPETVMKSVCAFLGLPFEPSMLEQRFKPDSSFKNDQERQQLLTQGQKALILVFSFFCRAVPWRIYHALYLLRRRLLGRHLPFWFFSLIAEKYGWSDLFENGHFKPDAE